MATAWDVADDTRWHSTPRSAHSSRHGKGDNEPSSRYRKVIRIPLHKRVVRTGMGRHADGTRGLGARVGAQGHPVGARAGATGKGKRGRAPNRSPEPVTRRTHMAITAEEERAATA